MSQWLAFMLALLRLLFFMVFSKAPNCRVIPRCKNGSSPIPNSRYQLFEVGRRVGESRPQKPPRKPTGACQARLTDRPSMERRATRTPALSRSRPDALCHNTEGAEVVRLGGLYFPIVCLAFHAKKRFLFFISGLITDQQKVQPQ